MNFGNNRQGGYGGGGRWGGGGGGGGRGRGSHHHHRGSHAQFRRDEGRNRRRERRFSPNRGGSRYVGSLCSDFRRQQPVNTQLRASLMKMEKMAALKRKEIFKVCSRWEENEEQFNSHPPCFPTFVPYGMSQEAMEAFMIRARIDEITHRLEIGIRIASSEIREPSPDPVFDNHGRRTNTRVERMKDRVTAERAELVHRAMKLHPGFKPPKDFKYEPKKHVRKLPIPVEKYPNYNFIGLIIGPRGSTQKKLESETGAKIAIRGKGSVKGGSHRRGPQPGQDEPLHVLITAENENILSRACDVIGKLLTPIEEGRNEFKRQQLRELARIHGTLRDESGAPETRTVTRQLKDYGKEGNMALRGDESMFQGHHQDRQMQSDGKTLHGHSIEKYGDVGNFEGNEGLDEAFAKFQGELEGVTEDQPFFEHYDYIKKKRGRIIAPGIEGLKRDHYLYCVQGKRERMEEEEDDEMDEEEDDFETEEEKQLYWRKIGDEERSFRKISLFDPILPPGTPEERTHAVMMQQINLIKKRERLLKRIAKREKKEKKKEKAIDFVIKEERTKAKKKQEISEQFDGEIPPWLLEE